MSFPAPAPVRRLRPWRSVGLFATLLLLAAVSLRAATPRETIVRAILAAEEPERRALVESLAGQEGNEIRDLLQAWREDALFLYAPAAEAERIPVWLTGEKDAAESQIALRLDTGHPLLDAAGSPLRLVAADLTPVEHDSALRRAIKSVFDAADLTAADPARRLRAVQTLGFSQEWEKLPVLLRRLESEPEPRVRTALREAIALLRLRAPDEATQLVALRELKELHPLAAADFVTAILREATAANCVELAEAAHEASLAIASHRSRVDFFGTLFRGVSLGSILLVVALGLAITFGLMGVINMAHGEMIAVGAYSTYLVQALFGTGVTLPFFGLSLGVPGMGLEGGAFQAYFLAALPISFLTAAGLGILLERGIIRFLYRRPLESLLATWGVSLILQQGFRLMFGSNNVQVASPSYLSGNWTLHDVLLNWNRVFVIGFALLIVVGVWLVLTKTSLGLLMRAVMQNRGMAACMGVRTQRVNMLTFGLGSGLAGLAGAFLSQIGNVGPSLGQSYIVDSFMVVVLGGVGNLVGTVVSAFGVGGVDQVFQQYLPTWVAGLGSVPGIGNFLQNLGQDSAVFGKILVLVGIILFLQWRPAGLFVTRSRGLDT